MRLHIMSDLHLEHGRMPKSYKAPDCDVVILAGDIGKGKIGVMWALEHFTVPVIYVPGNHEFYGQRVYDDHIADMKAKAAGSNVHVLNNEEIVIGGVRFLCATLWTDFDLYGRAPNDALVAAAKIEDYNEIKTFNRHVRLTTDHTRSWHLQSRYWLSESLRVPHEGKTVVVTHHAPSELSVHPKWRNNTLTAAYASRLENLVCNHAPDLWAHGHLHDTVDYQLCDTRVVCNPRGYVGHDPEDLNSGFDPAFVVEI